MTDKSSSREKKRTFLSLLSSKNNINEKKKSTVWGPLWDSPTRRIKKQKEEEEGRKPTNTISDFALTTPPNEPEAKERNNLAMEEKNAEDASSGKRSFLEASLGGFHATATGDEDDEEEEETMKDETMTMAKEEQQNGGEKSPAAVGEKVGELLLSRTLASKPPMKGFAFLKSSEFEQFKENYWQRQKEMKKKTKHASMIPRGPPPPPPLEEKIKKKTNVPKRRTTAALSNDDDDVHQNSPPVVLRGHVYSVVVPSAPSSESSSSLATREDQNRRRRRSFLVKLEAQFGDDGQKWQALEAYVSPSSYSSEESE